MIASRSSSHKCDVDDTTAVSSAGLSTTFGPHSRGGFTLIDLLVAMSVIAVLIALLMPAIGLVQEAARRVQCVSNTRQIGLGLQLYAIDADNQLPPSIFDAANEIEYTLAARSDQAVYLRVNGVTNPNRYGGGPTYDGLGFLVGGDYLDAEEVFYCPSHPGTITLDRFAGQLRPDSVPEVASNYHFRVDEGEGDLPVMGVAEGRSRRDLTRVRPTFALVSDSMRSVDELNHAGGLNALATDLSAAWLPDPNKRLAAFLEAYPFWFDPTLNRQRNLWNWLDERTPLGPADTVDDTPIDY